MFLRATLVAGTTVALLSLAGGGTAQASCLDDATARPLTYGYSPAPRSDRFPYYVEQTGTATFVVHGDALIADNTALTVDIPNYAQIVTGNTVSTTTTFVDCVAG